MSFISVHADGPPPDVPRNGVLEIVFEAAREVPFPFLAEGAVAFRSPSGTRYRADLFHDGGQAWGTRCHAREDGEWTWTSEAPDLPGIDGLEGRFHVVPSALPGALVPHPANPCALATEDGGAFLPVGDTAYALFAASDQRFGDWVGDSRAFGVNFLRTSVFGTLRTWDSHFAPNAMPALGPLRRQDALLRRLLDEWPAAHLEFILLPEHPDLFRTERIGVGVDCGRSLAEGWTLRDNSAPRTVDVTTDMDAEAARALLLETLLQAP